MSEPLTIPTSEEIEARIRACRAELVALRKLYRLARAAEAAQAAQDKNANDKNANAAGKQAAAGTDPKRQEEQP
jgi:hypothetical protein